MYLLYVQDEDTDIIFTAVSANRDALQLRAEALYNGWEMGRPWRGFAIDGENGNLYTEQADCMWIIEKVEVV